MGCVSITSVSNIYKNSLRERGRGGERGGWREGWREKWLGNRKNQNKIHALTIGKCLLPIKLLNKTKKNCICVHIVDFELLQ